MEKAEVLKYAKERAETHLEQGRWLAAWITFKNDMQKHDELRSHPVLSLGDTLVQFLFDSTIHIPAKTDEADAMKIYCNWQVKSMISAAK